MNQPAGAYGTGFYVQSKDGRPFVITAGHNVLDKATQKPLFNEWLKNVRFVFGFRLDQFPNQSKEEEISFRLPKEHIIEGNIFTSFLIDVL